MVSDRRSRVEISAENPEVRPLLGEWQLTTLRGYGREVAVVEGQVLFADGDPTYDLIVVLEGGVNIVEHRGRSDEAVVVGYGPREFLGEMSLLTGQRAYLSAVATSAGRVLLVPTEKVKLIMAEEADLSELILQAFLLRHARLTSRGSGPVLVGSRFDVHTHRLLELFARNRLPSRWLELEGSPEAETLLREVEVGVEELPIVIIPGGALLRNPTNRDLLNALGLVEAPAPDRSEACDLLVIGGGPAGLAAAVYGASDGLSTTIAEGTALGGQAGTSTRIENYLGFPAGLSGEELTARAVLQAQKFGVRVKIGATAVNLTSNAGVHEVRFDDGEMVVANSLIIATGARYNRLPLEGIADFEGVGVFYAATQMEASACGDGPVVVVGGGNSAGQAAIYLARTCAEVRIVIRGESLESSMSRYLIQQIERTPRIRVSSRTEVVALIGEQDFEGVVLRDNLSQESSEFRACGLFVFIGAEPCTGWLDSQLAEAEDGFLLTGTDVPEDQRERPGVTPLVLETSRPGVFCVGDVRFRSVKRVAAAVGEGAMALPSVFARLEADGLALANSPGGGALGVTPAGSTSG